MGVKKSNLVSIKSRVIVIVSALVAIISVLAGGIIYQKWNELSANRKSQDAFEIIREMHNLVYELQKERGLSAGRLGSKGKKLQSEVAAQRQHTDLQVKTVAGLFIQFRQKWENRSLLINLQKVDGGIKGIALLRHRVDDNDSAFHLFDSYSALMSLLINNGREIGAATIAAELINEFNSYLHLIWLLERSGQERGAVNGILGQGSFNVPVLLKVNGYISQQEKLLNDFNNSAQTAHITMLNESLNNPISMHVLYLRRVVIQQAELNDLLNKLHSFIGYGGLIHSFKNYVIRGDALYEQRFHIMLEQFKQLAHEIERLSGLGEESHASLLMIEETMERYHGYIDTVQEMRSQGKGVVDIDRVVKVDDGPAFAAIEFLRQNITQINQDDWWQSATKRMDKVNEVVAVVEQNLSADIQGRLDSAYYAMLYYLLLGSMILIISAIFAYYLINRVVGSLTGIANQLKNAAEQGNYNLLLSQPRGDEIGALADAFNKLIRERHTSEELLRKLSSSVEQSSESMLIVNSDNVIEYANPATLQQTGFEPREVLGQSINLFKYDKGIAINIARRVMKGKSWRGRAQIHRKNEGLRPVMLAISPIADDGGQITHLIIAQQDVSELEQLETQLQQAQKMEAIGTLVGGIAHDFNNILAGMTGKLYLARKRLKSAPEGVLEKLADVEDLGFKAAGMIQQLLAFARRDTVQVENLDLSRTIQEAFKLNRAAIPENIKIDSDFCNQPLPIQADSIQLHQALMNLLNNAAHAVKESVNPHISVLVDPFQADDLFIEKHPGLTSRMLARLSVEDNGYGMPEEVVKHVFEPFYTTKEVGKGTGLGLSMVYGAVKRHDGCITVESHPDEGCRIELYFPLIAEPETESEGIKEATLCHGDGETVLIADDNTVVLDTHATVLEDLGYKVIRASNGLEAVGCFKKYAERVSLVMLDVVMPNKGGVEAAREILEISPNMPIVFITGYDKEQTLIGEAEREQSIIIAKPVDIESLSLVLHQQIHNG